MKTVPFLSLLALSLAPATFLSTAQAGPLQSDGKSIAVPTAPETKTFINFRATTDYVFSSDFKNSGNLGNQDAFHANVQLGVSIPLDGPLYFVVNGFYDRFDFGTSLAPVPTTLHQVGVDVGVEYRVGGSAALAITASPGIYSSEINTDGFNVPVVAYGSYQLTDSVVIIAGVRYNQWSSYSFLPLAGLVWTVNDTVKLDLTLPDPALVYKVDEDLSLRFGGEILGGTYKTAKSEQNLPHENLDYFDVRAGVKANYRGFKPLNLQVSAGWSFEREFSYDDAEAHYKTNGAPFVSFSARTFF